jgi:iron(III) transport system ATP-binding protein
MGASEHAGHVEGVRARAGVSIEVRAVTQRFGGLTVLNGIDLDVPGGSVLALLGASGCGKSTLLKLLAGLQRPTAGTISFDGRIVAEARRHDAPEKRGLGMVFQDYALWPHMTVAQNVAFPLQMQGVAAGQRKQRVATALERVGLGALGDRRPADLSGGQQQRAALARAIVHEPAILLFDEPLSNLDRELRESLCIEIRTLLNQVGATAVYVTHDHDEAYALAHRVAHMERGVIRDVITLQP